ncbi:VIT1/CCC1 transporter family protein [Pontibacter sp. MBLB2868]|uniref:VIT1/CCC1 transporter family protein n=1 Tax=Pontibacter sp. MBLB2868 TaxID=3451555 RepID=UPI003F752958
MPRNPEQLQHTSLYSRFQEYLGEFVYGGMDGCVTTFAVVAGSVGAELSSSVIIILGFANLLADGFSMSVGAYLSTRSEYDSYEKFKRTENLEIKNKPKEEVQEIREIYRSKGFEGELLEQVVAVIVKDKDRWVDDMMKNELGLIKNHKSPLAIGTVTYISFLLIGMIPLSVYIWDFFTSSISEPFLWTSVFTSVGFLVIGFLKSYVNRMNKIRGMLETFALGTIAAGVSYFVGDILEGLIK